MPNKYSHSVVLAHYSSLGLIDLPNDQYIAYLKTYPSSGRTSISSRSKAHPNGTQGSTTPSTGYGGRYRILEHDIPSSTSITGRREYLGPVTSRRNVIVESDEGSGDEHVTLHRKHEPIEFVPQPQRRSAGHELRTEKRKLPSISTYTGRSSSEVSEGVVPAETQQPAPSENMGEPKRSPPSIINLNEYELMPAAQAPESASTQHPEPAASLSADSKMDHIAGQVMPVNGRTASSVTEETGVYHPNPQLEPDFGGFSDQRFSEVTITGVNNADKDSSSSVPKSQFSKSFTSDQHTGSSSKGPVPLPKRVDSAAGFNRNPMKQRQPRRNHSYDSISSIDSKDVVHLTTALPPVVPPKSQKPLRNKTGKNNPTSGDRKVDDDAIDPSFFETLRGGPRQTSASPTSQRFAGLSSNPPPLPSRPSQQYSRKSADHAPPNPDFWRGLEDMLSDSDASVVFPPDIAKYKPRDSDIAPARKPDTIPRDRMDDGELKRPTTAPAPKTSSRDAFASHEPLPNSQSRTTVTNNNGGLDKPKDFRKLTTVELVDTSAQKKGKRGFLRKLRKRSYKERMP